MVNAFRPTPINISDINSTVEKLKLNSMDHERDSFQTTTHHVENRPISISPCGAEDENTTAQPTPKFDWKEGMINESRHYFHGGIVSLPSKGDSTDEDVYSHRKEFDTPLDYRVDWTTQMSMVQKQLPLQETSNDLYMDDTSASLGDDDMSILDMCEETFDKEEIVSFSSWLKSNKDSDIWAL